VPLIFVGHSMGGLIIKKAFILGHEISDLKPLVRRVCSILFLATPHQGADLAQTLNRILNMTLGSRPFVQDLSPDSPVIESINEEFPRYCGHLQLFSFFENKPTNYVLGRGFIVDKQCAVMNYVNERKMYLDACHREVARFSSPSDPSYITIRNTLAAYIADKRGSKESSRQLMRTDELELLNKFLGISDSPEDDLMTQDSIRVPGTCEWLLHKDCFQQWRDAAGSKVLWLQGRPGMGKSVLSGHVISRLRDLNNDCCFFFFTERDKLKATINFFLRSMAWQMAMLHRDILSSILEVSAKWQDAPFNKVDPDPIWRRLYLRGILKVQLSKPQYWVIDALDECKGASELMTFLMRAQEFWPLRILVTSRDPVTPYMSATNVRVEIVSETIVEEDTEKDIWLFLKANLDLLPSATPSRRMAIADQVLHTSSGCFLWVALALKELQQVHTSAEIRRILSSNSETMDGLYSKILADMATAKFGKELAKAILTWTASSFRPLSTDEIHRAIELDINDTIDDVGRSISIGCGNLVYVDSRKKVQLIHLSAREFLTRQDIVPDFIIERTNAHRRLALVCLQYLCSNEMRGPRPRKLSIPQEEKERSPFADYACKFLFQHLVCVRAYDDEIIITLSKFLGSVNVLSWIEYLAAQSDLQRLFQAGKTINDLSNRRSQHTPPLGLRTELSLMERWGNDLIHLVTKFGKQLSLTPSCIHQQIPPFCPQDSALKRQFASSNRGLGVYGVALSAWDDCLSIINYLKPASPLTVAASDRYFATGMSTGKIIIYDDVTCQESQTLDHREPVWCLAFGETGKYLASSGAKSVRVWDLVSWSELFRFSIPKMCMVLSFVEDDSLLLGAIKNNELLYWDVANGGKLCDEPTNWTRDSEKQASLRFRQPTTAAFSPHQSLLALVYRGEYILLWDYESDRLHDTYEKVSGSRGNGSTKVSDGSTTVWSLSFSPAVDTTLLAAAYSDGDVAVYDTSTGEVRGILISMNAQTLSFSPDGRTLASADSTGAIQLVDVKTLKFIYRLQFDSDQIVPTQLNFSSDGHRIIDIRGNQCRIWNPVVLLRQDMEDENSDTVSVSTMVQETDYQWAGSVPITAITCVRSGSIFLCGKEDGSVYVYDISLEPQSQQLFVQTAGMPILLLHFDVERGILTCSDCASRVVSREVIRNQRTRWETRDPLIDIRTGTRIDNIITSGRHSHLLVSTKSDDTIWLIGAGNQEKCLVRWETKEERHWVQHATNPDHLVLITRSEAKIYHWTTMECLATVSLADVMQPFTAVREVIQLPPSRFFATVANDTSQGRSSQSAIQVWDLNDFTVHSTKVSCAYDLGTFSANVEALIGVVGDRWSS
jgi:WD40 repeat protein